MAGPVRTRNTAKSGPSASYGMPVGGSGLAGNAGDPFHSPSELMPTIAAKPAANVPREIVGLRGLPPTDKNEGVTHEKRRTG